MHPEERIDIMQRLHSAEGHIRAVIGMVEVDESCEQVLHQLDAVLAALRAVRARILASQVKTSESVIMQNACPEELVAELNRLSNLYQIMMRSNKYNRE